MRYGSGERYLDSGGLRQVGIFRTALVCFTCLFMSICAASLWTTTKAGLRSGFLDLLLYDLVPLATNSLRNTLNRPP